jgi:hypothetical protein
MRVASTDWCASRHVVSINSIPLWSRTGFGERGGALLVDDLLEPRRRRLGGRLGRDGFDDCRRRSYGAWVARAVHRDVREVAQ